jgi:hypothetical protein
MAIILPFFLTPVVCIAAIVFWSELRDFFYFLSDNFWLFLLFGGAVAGYYWLAVLGDTLTEEEEPNDLLWGVCLMSLPFYIVLVVGASWGHSPDALVRFIGSIIYFFAFIIGIPVISIGLLMATATIPHGIIALFTTHPAEKTVAHHVVLRRPSNVVEKELAEILRSHNADLKRARELVGELPRHLQYIHTIKLRAKAQKQERMHKALQEQQKVVQRDQDIAKEAHELERAKRADGSHDELAALMQKVKFHEQRLNKKMAALRRKRKQ